jgi:uncharacterized protein
MFMSLTHLEPAALLRRAGLFVLALLAVCCQAAPVQAQSTTLAARSHTIQIAVLGDSVAHDLGRGMEDLFDNNKSVHVVRQTKFATGLVRTDYYDWNKVTRDFLRKHKPNVILVVMGGNDNQTIRRNGKRYDPGTKAWRAEYARLVSHFMNNFRHSHAKIYWVSLPPVRSKTLTRAYRTFNRIYRYEAKRHGIHYVNVWNKLLTRSGAYSSFGESLEGVRRQIRKDDGEHFTDVGRLLFASYVAHAIGLR